MLKKQLIGVLFGFLMLMGSVWAQSININQADAEALTTLSGVGSVIAERIIVEREDGGDFRSAEDVVERVNGLGESFIENNAGRLDF